MRNADSPGPATDETSGPSSTPTGSTRATRFKGKRPGRRPGPGRRPKVVADDSNEQRTTQEQEGSDTEDSADRYAFS